jgi:hypothetical protein
MEDIIEKQIIYYNTKTRGYKDERGSRGERKAAVG